MEGISPEKMEEEMEVVISGGGISGLAIALALHRKGVKSLVLERSERLRASGGGLGVHCNGWRALEQLGIASRLRQMARPLQGSETDEFRCLKRGDLINELAKPLPQGTIRFGSEVISVHFDPLSSQPCVQLQDGSIIKSKVLIGCDGSRSPVAEFLGLKPAKHHKIWAIRGFTNFPNGHDFTRFVETRFGKLAFGIFPIDATTIYWFLAKQGLYPPVVKSSKDPKRIQEFGLASRSEGLSEEMVEIITKCDLQSLTINNIRYRSPWDILTGGFRKGTVTVAGEAMHGMGPFIGQGGSTALEDAVVLGRSLAKRLCDDNHDHLTATNGSSSSGQLAMLMEVIDEFVKERRMRLVQVSMHSYIVGCIFRSSSILVKLLFVVLMLIFFRDSRVHTNYDCGHL